MIPPMELAGALSNPEVGARLARAGQAVAGLKPGMGSPRLIEPPPAQGQILRAIKGVMADRPEGLRTIEIWRRVEARLGRAVRYSTIKADLADNVGDGACFERPRRGVYRLRSLA